MKETPGVSQIRKLFPQEAELYLKYLGPHAKDYYGNVGAADIQRRLLSQETLDTTTLTELQNISQSAQENATPFVQRARSELRDFFLPHVQSLREQGVFLVLYGSLQYGDPKNCDVDLLPVALQRDQTTESMERFLYDRGIELEEYWSTLPNENGQRRGDAADHRLLYLSDFIDIGLLFDKDKGDFATDPADLAPIISGIPLFLEDTQAIESLQIQAKEIVVLDPLTTAIVNHALAGCLKERQSRRK